MIRKLFILSVLCASAFAATAGEPKQSPEKGAKHNSSHKFAYSGFSGGMMVHTGWLFGGEITLSSPSGGYSRQIKGAPTGIGGAARVHLGDHLRIGSEGYMSTLNYGGRGNKSHARIGWGGILADCIWQLGRWAPYVGGTIGGGSYANLTLREATPVDTVVETDASFRKYSYMVLAPFAGVEFAMTDKIRLNFKVDWMINLTNRQSDFAGGPRLYFGFSFYRLKGK